MAGMVCSGAVRTPCVQAQAYWVLRSLAGCVSSGLFEQKNLAGGTREPASE